MEEGAAKARGGESGRREAPIWKNLNPIKRGDGMDLRNSLVARRYFSLLDRSVVAWMQKREVRPNTVTSWGLAAACLVPVGFGLSPWAGFVFLVLSGVADTLDGFLARATKQQSRFGSFWDSTLDRAADCAYLLGFLIMFWSFPRWRLEAAVVLFVALLGTMLISYIKAKVESLGQTCKSGVMSRPVRVIYLLVWALLLAVFSGMQLEVLWVGLGGYLALTAFTVGQRITEAKRVLA
jgi:CDP-diacylglycerol--glycerol-3-phosphate 3-phosphatidyltransferase